MSLAQKLATPVLSPNGPRRSVVGILVTWADRRRTRMSLNRLDAHLLRDIGIDARDAGIEAARPFWTA